MSAIAESSPRESLAGRLARSWSGRRRWPLVSAVGALIASAGVLLPLAFLVVQAQESGWSTLQRLVFRHTTAVLLWNSVRLAVACTLLCAVIGVGAAWLVERSDVPLRRVWAVLLVLPLGVPDFVVAFGWVSIAPALHGYLAAVMIMTLSLYPLVYLPVASAMRNLDAGLHETARSLGLSPARVFLRVTLRQVWPAVLGGCLLVTLGLLAEYGAFEIVRYQTFTVQIFTEFKLGFDAAAACGLSLVLVALSVAVLGGELALTAAAARSARARAPRVPCPGRSCRVAGAGPPSRGLRPYARSRWASRSARSSTGWSTAARRRCRAARCSPRSGTRSSTAPRPPPSPRCWRCRSARWRCATATG